jgi:acyl-coenzyme A synthetase/AMP-(fatty) acid ligase
MSCERRVASFEVKDWREVFADHGEKLALIGGPEDARATYRELAEAVSKLCREMSDAGIDASSVIGFPAQYSLDGLATFFAIADLHATAVPLPEDAGDRIERLLEIAHATHWVKLSACRPDSPGTGTGSGGASVGGGGDGGEVASKSQGGPPRVSSLGLASRPSRGEGEMGVGGRRSNDTWGEVENEAEFPEASRDDTPTVGQTASGDDTPTLYRSLQAVGHAGLVLFTSGTTGDPKAAVQDIDGLRLRYAQHRDVGKMLAFMQMDHIGGINTMLYVMTHGGSMVVPRSRSPQDVAAIIETHRIEVLPVSPTFLNLMLITGVIDQYDLSSLRRITYGSEPMPESVLRRLGEVLPGVDLLQTYGTTEMGILKSKSESNDSLWMKVGGEGYETKVVDGRLWIRAQTAMLGYLNAPSPFDEDGYMDTGDEVEVRGEWIRVRGRKSEFINVGGTKVSPTEVESALLEMPQVCEASVSGMKHPLMGQVVRATVRLNDSCTVAEFKSAMREHCKDRLPQEAIPVKVSLASDPLVTERFKRRR